MNKGVKQENAHEYSAWQEKSNKVFLETIRIKLFPPSVKQAIAWLQ